MLDLSKSVFLDASCMSDISIHTKILTMLQEYKVPQEKIREKIDMDIINSGDYLIRHVDDKVQVWEIKLTVPFGFTRDFVGNL